MNDAQELIDYFQMLLDYAEKNAQNLNQESQQALAKFISQIQEIVVQVLQRNQEAPTPPTPPQNPEVPVGDFPSSNVNGFKYDPKNQEMYVQFHGPYPQAAGPVYKYSGVPSYIFDVISKGRVGPKTSGKNRYHQWFRGVTPSLGASVNALLKAGGFSYKRLS